VSPRCYLRVFFLLWCTLASTRAELREDGYHVFPGEEIQPYLDAAATNATQKRVIVHSGTYAPSSRRQSLIWLNRRHDGITLQAEGAVTLTARNRDLAPPSSTNMAVVNHVIYIGHLVSSNTSIKGFHITGANAFCTKGATRRFEPDESVLKNLFFFTDGGAVKIFGRSSPVLSNLVIEDNYTSPCAGGISVQQEGLKDNPVTIRDCVFRSNTAQVTGAALDLLGGSAAVVENCLFVNNASNLGEDIVATASKEKPFLNSGVLTVFEGSSLVMRRCTFTGNRNAVDDRGGKALIEDSIFYNDNLKGGLPGKRYELEMTTGSRMNRNLVNGVVRYRSLEDQIVEKVFEAPDPQFDPAWAPQNRAYDSIGYQPNSPSKRMH
jgi:hypothetical protein